MEFGDLLLASYNLLAAPVVGEWDWNLSNLIAAIAVVLVAIAHTAAAVMFFVKWNTSLALVRQDFNSFKAEMASFKDEVRADFTKVADKLDLLADRGGRMAVLEAAMRSIERRVERVEGAND